MSEPWRTPLARIPNSSELDCYRLESLFEPGAGLWKELWASLVLTAREREEFRKSKTPEHLQMEWLSGRTVAKDAMRSFLRRSYGMELLPADIEIAHDRHGRPIATGPWARHLRAVPELAVAQTPGMAVALAGDGGRVGIEVQAVGPEAASLTTDLTADEQRLLNAVAPSMRAEWSVRFACAKRAAAKAVGRVRILALNINTAVVEAVGESAGEKVKVYTAREGAFVVASAIQDNEYHDTSQPRNHFDGCAQTSQ